jgi:hypothetical protein
MPVIFNGEDPDGRRLSYETQYRLFRRATLVVGPHGSGLTNIFWMSPHIRTSDSGGEQSTIDACMQRPAVLEFITNEETSAEDGSDGEGRRNQVQPGSSGKSYYSLLGGVPHVRYYHLFLASNSTNAAIWVDPGKFAAALNQIFAPSTSGSGAHELETASLMKPASPAPFQAEVDRKRDNLSPNQLFMESRVSFAAAEYSASKEASEEASKEASHNAATVVAPAAMPAASVPFTYVLASHKTGSTFLWGLFKGLARISGQCLLDGEKPNDSAEGIPLNGSLLMERCPKGGVLFTRRTLHPGYQREVASMLLERSGGSDAAGCRGVFQTRNPYDVCGLGANLF